MAEIPYRQDVFRKIEPPPRADPPFTGALYQVQEDRGSFSRRAEKLHEKDPVTGESAAMRGAKTLNEKDPMTGESLGMKGVKRSSEIRMAKAKGERVARQYGQWEVKPIHIG